MKPKSGSLSLYLAAFVANVLALAVGVAFSWTSPVLPKLNGSVDPDNNPLGRPITSSEESLITSLLSLGSLIGLVPAGMAADKLGRKKTLLILACPVVLSFLMMAFAQSVYLFFIARFLMGLGAGSVFIILPMYLGEIAEDHNRGIMSCLMGNFNSSGLVFAFTIGPYLSVQWFCLVCLIPLLIFIPIFWIWNPETPQYFASIGDQKELEKSLLKLRSKSIDGIQKEALEISRMVQELSKNKGGVRELFVTQSSRKGLVITLSLAFLQQFAGINAVISYMQTIFEAAGSSLPPEISAMIIAAVQLATTIVTSSLVDRLGRRILLLISTTGACLSQVTLGLYFFLQDNDFQVDAISWLPITSLISFIIFFNIGLAFLSWTVMAELFPPNVKSAAVIFTGVVCFIGAFITTLFFPALTTLLGMAGAFWVFATCCATGTVFLYFMLPETKGRSLQEIQKLLGKNSK